MPNFGNFAQTQAALGAPAQSYYAPLPFEELALAGASKQKRADSNLDSLDQGALGILQSSFRSKDADTINQLYNQYTNEQSELLKKGIDPGSAEFKLEANKIVNKFKSDPRVAQLAKLKADEDMRVKLSAEIASKSGKPIDFNPTFEKTYSELSESGELSSVLNNLGIETMLNPSEDIDKAYASLKNNKEFTALEGAEGFEDQYLKYESISDISDERVRKAAISIATQIDATPSLNQLKRRYMQDGLDEDAAIAEVTKTIMGRGYLYTNEQREPHYLANQRFKENNGNGADEEDIPQLSYIELNAPGYNSTNSNSTYKDFKKEVDSTEKLFIEDKSGNYSGNMVSFAKVSNEYAKNLRFNPSDSFKINKQIDGSYSWTDITIPDTYEDINGKKVPLTSTDKSNIQKEIFKTSKSLEAKKEAVENVEAVAEDKAKAYFTPRLKEVETVLKGRQDIIDKMRADDKSTEEIAKATVAYTDKYGVDKAEELFVLNTIDPSTTKTHYTLDELPANLRVWLESNSVKSQRDPDGNLTIDDSLRKELQTGGISKESLIKYMTSDSLLNSTFYGSLGNKTKKIIGDFSNYKEQLEVEKDLAYKQHIKDNSVKASTAYNFEVERTGQSKLHPINDWYRNQQDAYGGDLGKTTDAPKQGSFSMLNELELYDADGIIRTKTDGGKTMFGSDKYVGVDFTSVTYVDGKGWMMWATPYDKDGNQADKQYLAKLPGIDKITNAAFGVNGDAVAADKLLASMLPNKNGAVLNQADIIPNKNIDIFKDGDKYQMMFEHKGVIKSESFSSRKELLDYILYINQGYGNSGK